MNIWKKILLGIVAVAAPVVEDTAEEKLEDLLDKVYAKNPDWHKTICQSFYPGAKLLKQITDETPTPADDIAPDAMIEAIEASAAKYNVELPA